MIKVSELDNYVYGWEEDSGSRKLRLHKSTRLHDDSLLISSFDLDDLIVAQKQGTILKDITEYLSLLSNSGVGLVERECSCRWDFK